MGLLNKKTKENLAKESYVNKQETDTYESEDKLQPELKKESIPASEVALETTGDRELSEQDQSLNTPSQQAVIEPHVPNEQLTQIEQILEADLGEPYAQMDSQHQHLFKMAGERTAKQISQLLSQTKVKAQKIFELIKAWLQLIPNISKWFVVQEAKIKTDKIINIKK